MSEATDDAVHMADQTRRYESVMTDVNRCFDAETCWEEFYAEVIGLGGILSQAFPVPADRAEFERSPYFGQILDKLAERRQRVHKRADAERCRVITVRCPVSMYEALSAEAHRHQTSLNKLCISKLSLPVKAKHVY